LIVAMIDRIASKKSACLQWVLILSVLLDSDKQATACSRKN